MTHSPVLPCAPVALDGLAGDPLAAMGLAATAGPADGPCRLADAKWEVDVVARGSMPKLYPRELAAIFAGGIVGAVVRAGLAELVPHPPGAWPWATFTVNVVGALLLGYFVTRLQERLPVSRYPRPLLGTGLCGALTTFSTMQVELVEMLERGHLALAAGYAGASVATGFVVVWLASAYVRRARVLL
jgi:CrcB protein